MRGEIPQGAPARGRAGVPEDPRSAESAQPPARRRAGLDDAKPATHPACQLRGRFPLSGHLGQQGGRPESSGGLPRGAPSRPPKLEAEGLSRRLNGPGRGPAEIGRTAHLQRRHRQSRFRLRGMARRR